jgi:hypothetical protein
MGEQNQTPTAPEADGIPPPLESGGFLPYFFENIK